LAVALETIVINTGPLILLEKAGALDLPARRPFQFVCPPAVRGELDAGGAKGYAAVNVPWLTVLPLNAPLSPLAQATLDAGEAEVIQLALERGFRQVCLDDLRGRRIALASGLRVTGVLGLLALAKQSGLISVMKPYCDRLLKGGAWYSPELVKRVLLGVGE
jgi:predicted nucleic acid-binding protein